MKVIHLIEHGRPDAVCACVEVDDPGAPGDDEVVVEIQAAAINPADLLTIEGRYPGATDLPAVMGIEGAGRIVSVGVSAGSAAGGLAPGDKVISLGRANWAERIRVKADAVIVVPQALDIRDAAMLKANPPSAHFMLRDFVDLRPGDWVIQNAANSAVGRHVIAFARKRNLRSINVVRRETLIAELEALGADLVVLDGDDLGRRVRGEIGAEAPVRLAIDAVGGRACQRLADCLSDGGTVVNYGFLSGEPCMITPHHTILHGITLEGFWLRRGFGDMPRADIEALYADIARHFIDGTLNVPVEATYGLEDIGQALAHALREGRGGKVLLLPQGPID